MTHDSNLAPPNLSPPGLPASGLPAPGLPAPGLPAPGWRPTALILFLRVVGGISLLAFAAAVMPEAWMVHTAEALGFEPFPYSPLTFYLARNLSLLYGFVGAFLLAVSMDLPRYRQLIRYAAIGTILFGVLQLIVDTQSGLPAWWTWGESISTFLGGVLLYWIQLRTNFSE